MKRKIELLRKDEIENGENKLNEYAKACDLLLSFSDNEIGKILEFSEVFSKIKWDIDFYQWKLENKVK